jgi:hypothetical protein
VLVVVVGAELYLAADHLSAAAYGLLLAPCVADVAFRWLVPDEGFPIGYRRQATAAHLDLGGEREAAIVRAMRDQLGLRVTEVKEFGLEGSAGSSPPRMTLDSGLQVRPSPWRQAVDLSNMLLTLALRTDPERVYARATRVFTPDEIAEAVACAVGLTIPTELQAKMAADGRPLLLRFRRLAPPRERVSIQRWSPQRLLLTAGAALGCLFLVGLFLDSLRAGLG